MALKACCNSLREYGRSCWAVAVLITRILESWINDLFFIRSKPLGRLSFRPSGQIFGPVGRFICSEGSLWYRSLVAEGPAAINRSGPRTRTRDGCYSMHVLLLVPTILASGLGSTTIDPAALVAELGAPRFAQRQAAEESLGRLGRGALPALRVAATNTDPEIRTRALGVLQRVEAGLLTDPTLIRLDFDDVPLSEALETINRRAETRIVIAPQIRSTWAQRRINLRLTEPLPFWKAVDVICAAGQVHHVFGGLAEFEPGDATFPLYDGFAASRGLYDDHGPFRIQLTSLQYQSEVHLSTDDTARGRPGGDLLAQPERAPSEPIKQFFLQLLVGAEPRLAIMPAEPARLTEAVDNRGRTLLAPPRTPVLERDSGYLGVNSSPLVHIRLDLQHPGSPAGRIKLVRGVIPLVVSTRRPDPLIISLGAHAAKTAHQGSHTITVGEIRAAQPDQLTTIELTIKSAERSPSGADPRGGVDDEIRSIASPQQLEVLDAAGRSIPWFPTSSVFDGDEARLTLSCLDRGPTPAIPVTIRYHGLIRSRTEVPFEFRDLPMP